MIVEGHEGRELTVLAEGGEVAAFVLGEPGNIVIFETRPEHRGRGHGRALAEHAVARAAAADVAVIEFECSPETSLGFWEGLGFTERPAPWGDNPWAYLRVPKRFELPVGDAVDVAIRTFSEEVLYRDGTPAISEHRPSVVVDEHGVVHLAERVAIAAPELPNGKDVAVEIVVDGERRLLTKAKYDEARGLGVRQDR